MLVEIDRMEWMGLQEVESDGNFESHRKIDGEKEIMKIVRYNRRY